MKEVSGEGGRKMIPKLTKEEAIREHRKMWNWIAEQYEQYGFQDIACLKDEYLNTYRPEFLSMDSECFCCEYVTQQGAECTECPVVWGGNKAYICTSGEYGRLCCVKKDKFIAGFLARKIANLPEKKDEEVQQHE